MNLNMDEIRGWYDCLDQKEQLELWQRFSTFLSNGEIRRTMEDLASGKGDLFEIHHRAGLISKYQIYFLQIMRHFS